MKFVTYKECAERFRGKNVCIVGSGPSALENRGEFIDSHDIVVRVQNYKIKGYEDRVGRRTDVHHSFYGNSVRKTAAELKADGVSLCMCKCANTFVDSAWHKQNKKPYGEDWRYIYRNRKNFWFCDTYIPTPERYFEYMARLSNQEIEGVKYRGEPIRGHMPTSGFAAILDVLGFETKSLYLTGFDFFRSGKHDIDQPWEGLHKNPDDPMRHRPDLELEYMRRIKGLFDCDPIMRVILEEG